MTSERGSDDGRQLPLQPGWTAPEDEPQGDEHRLAPEGEDAPDEDALESEDAPDEDALESEDAPEREGDPEPWDAGPAPEDEPHDDEHTVSAPRAPRAGRRQGPRDAMFQGAVLGAALGDAVGHPTEFIASFAGIRAKYGPEGVTGPTLFWERDGKRFTPYTDDTQMAEVVLRSLLESRAQSEDLDAAMRRMGRGFVEWAAHPQGGHRAPGNACLSGCRALEQGVRWSEAGGATAGGCGSVMRAYPFGLVFAGDLHRAERWAVAHSRLTHGDPIALAACAAMAVGMARVVRGETLDVVLSEMVAAACRYCAKTAAMVATAIHEARTGVSPEVTLQRLQGWAAHEAIAAAAYVFARHPDDPGAAILEGANTPGDSDSIATLAGALVGARCGALALPEAWVRDLERAEELRDLALEIG